MERAQVRLAWVEIVTHRSSRHGGSCTILMLLNHWNRMHTFTLKERIGAASNVLPTAVYDAFPNVLFGRILVLARKLGVFESLHHRPQTPRELALALGLDQRGVELILPALESAKYLRHKGGKFSLAPQSTKWLLASSPHYLGNFLAYIELLQSHWMYVEETLRTGRPPSIYPETFTDREWRVYTLGMMDLARLIIPRLLPHLTIPPGASALLDLCGSHGLYSIEMCKRSQQIIATIADYPQVLTTTREIVNTHGMADRITLLPCDVTSTAFPTGKYDIVFAFNIIHGFDEEMNRRLIASASSALKPGGIVHIVDQLEPTSSKGAQTLLPLMIGINLLNEIGGSIYSFSRIRAWCDAAGFAEVRERKLSLPGVSLISGRKRS